MNILGIDPGPARCGYAVIDEDLTVITSGVIETKSDLSYLKRVDIVKRRIAKIIKDFDVTVAGMEKPFVGKNVKSGVEVAGVWGVLGQVIYEHHCHYLEPSVTQVKSAVSSGQATKEEVKRGVEVILDIDLTGRLDDESDALAVAICTRDRWALAERIRCQA